MYLEALACGLPVVGSVLDGSREALMEGALGALVDPDDSNALEQTILDGLKKTKGVVPDLLQHYSVVQFSDRLDRLLRSLSAHGQAAVPPSQQQEDEERR